jgi:hypothetical protein
MKARMYWMIRNISMMVSPRAIPDPVLPDMINYLHEEESEQVVSSPDYLEDPSLRRFFEPFLPV